jgi:beta-N-acetylhexosaminidase
METGFLLTVGIPGPYLDGETRTFLERVRPGGVILFRRNVHAGLGALQQLIADLHALPWQPLVAIDHEGGRVVRLGEPFTHFPAAAAIGRKGDPNLARSVAAAMGRELVSVGFDLVFAPVLDVLTRADNTVIGDRAFSSDPLVVARLGAAQVEGYREAGILCCGKHFPGHGDTVVDSHVGLPRVDTPDILLRKRELVPFRQAIASAVPMLMTAHVVYEGVGSHVPATLEPYFLRTVLREELGFEGVVVSDDLEMGAIVERGGVAEAAIASIRAGADGVLVCQTSAAALAVAEALKEAVAEGSFRRHVEKARQRWDALRRLLPRERVSCALPNTAHRELAATID